MSLFGPVVESEQDVNQKELQAASKTPAAMTAAVRALTARRLLVHGFMHESYSSGSARLPAPSGLVEVAVIRAVDVVVLISAQPVAVAALLAAATLGLSQCDWPPHVNPLNAYLCLR